MSGNAQRCQQEFSQETAMNHDDGCRRNAAQDIQAITILPFFRLRRFVKTIMTIKICNGRKERDCANNDDKIAGVRGGQER